MKILCGDCEHILKSFPPDSVDLIVTSPPYAMARKHTYGSVRHEDYVEWFLPKSAEFMRVLKPSGSFVLNIKENAQQGERTLYVYDLLLALKRGQGWKFVDDLIWHKRTCYPGGWSGRLKDAWEHLYHFTKTLKYVFNKDEVRIPAAAATVHRAAHLSERDKALNASRSGSGMVTKPIVEGSLFTSTPRDYCLRKRPKEPCEDNGKWNRLREMRPNGGIEKVSNDVREPTALPSNVLHMSPESHNQHHSAVFPVRIPTFFIKLLSNPGGLVLDPFCGSSSVGVACKDLGRDYVGIDILEENVKVSMERLGMGGGMASGA